MNEPQDIQSLTDRPTSSKSSAERFRRAAWYTAALAMLGGISLVAGFETARRTLATPHAEGAYGEASSAHAIAPARMPAVDKSDEAELNRLPVQQRAERLLERAMHQDERSLDLLQENVDGWRGHLKSTDRLFDLVLAALNSADLRVRTAAIDVDLAANNLSKTPASVSRLLREMESDPASVGMSLWRLGALGNRGVEPETVLKSLLLYGHSRNEHTRYWAVEGLSMLGNDATIDPLLELMAHDPSARVRELAASSLAQGGMLTREERLAAVPHLLNFADDDSLNATTRELVYGALRVITGAELGNDAEAWREWWANHDPARERPRARAGVVRT
jgi:hypothetical protein